MARRAALLVAGAAGGRSIIGGVTRGRPGETWPLDAEGRPMDAIAQVDFESCPLRLEGLDEVAVVSVFCASGHWPTIEPSEDNWVAREYRRGEVLIPLPQPEGLAYNPVPATWAPIDTDYPDPDEWPAELGREAMQWSGEQYDNFCARHRNQQGHKAGGWPFYVQSRPDWPPTARFVFQIAAEPLANMGLGDAGVMSFARTPSGIWYADMQCY